MPPTNLMPPSAGASSGHVGSPLHAKMQPPPSHTGAPSPGFLRNSHHAPPPSSSSHHQHHHQFLLHSEKDQQQAIQRDGGDVMEVIRSRFSLFKSNSVAIGPPPQPGGDTAMATRLVAPPPSSLQYQAPAGVQQRTSGGGMSSWLSRSNVGYVPNPVAAPRGTEQPQQQLPSHNGASSRYAPPHAAAARSGGDAREPATAATSSTTTTSMCSRWVGLGAGGDLLAYRGPEPPPAPCNMRLYDAQGPVCFPSPPFDGGQHPRAELRSWACRKELIISQNSSKRKVQRGLWLCPLTPDVSYPVAVKFVEDRNARDGRSVKREIECHLFIYQRLQQIQEDEGYPTPEDAWPSAELFGYHLDRKNPGRCVLITRKLSGPDFFDVIRQEHSGSGRVSLTYEYHKLHWCSLALRRVQQYARMGIRHNDIKPDNIVLDFYDTAVGERALDVKIIDLGTASMHSAKEFTGGTSWYESPEQKVLEFYSKKQRNQEKARQVDIGLASDVWAAGLSITEVLVGRRVVDCLKLPHGPGPLDYRSPEESWAVEPAVWAGLARKALLSAPREASKYTFCFDAARYIFDQLVRPDPLERGTLQDAIDELAHQTQRALDKSKKAASSICPARTT